MVATERWAVRPIYPFEADGRRYLFVVESAAFAELGEESWAVADFLAARKRATGLEVLGALGSRIGDDAVRSGLDEMSRLGVLVPADLPWMPPDARVPVRTGFGSLTLHVAHDCNLRCGYCYAEYGRYGGEAGMMSPETAVLLVDRLFDDAADRRVVHVTFFGGEPLLNMPAVYAAAERAESLAKKSGRELRMGLTTNGTLLTSEIAAWLREHHITVSVSLDGPADVNDRLRPYADGRGSYEAVVDAVRRTGLRCVARVTLTRRSTDVARIVRHLVDVGFHEVGVAPVATGDARYDLGPAHLEKVLVGYRALAVDFVDAIANGRSFPFSNLRAMIEQIHAGEARPMPCGAGLELAAASMDGELYACHRMLGAPSFRTGSLASGIDEPARWKFLSDHHPRNRPPCETCWARFLCGGGCHHMAHVLGPKDGPVEIPEFFCDFLRAQFRIGLLAYAEIATRAPGWLDRLDPAPTACSQPVGF